jgi:hypothetical protein
MDPFPRESGNALGIKTARSIFMVAFLFEAFSLGILWAMNFILNVLHWLCLEFFKAVAPLFHPVKLGDFVLLGFVLGRSEILE